MSSLLLLTFGGILANPADAVPGPGILEICKSSANGMSGQTFQFTLDATPLEIKGGDCTEALSLPPGPHTIVETPPAGIEVKRIQANRVVSKDVAAGTITVNVKANSTEENETLVTFTNRPIQAVGLKICKQAPPTLEGDLYTFTENGGFAHDVAAGRIGTPICGEIRPYDLGTIVDIAELPVPGTHVSAISVSNNRGSNVDLEAGTVTATIGAGITSVTYTNRPDEIAQDGYIEVCKFKDDPYVSGHFDFTITDSSGEPKKRTVLTGQCTEPILVRAGNVSVAEAARSPYYASAIYAIPEERLVTQNLANRTITVTVVKGDTSTETAVIFKNATRVGYVKVCKELTRNGEALANTPFYFTVTGVNGPHNVTVWAGAAGTTSCVIDPKPLPLGSAVSITEQAVANVKNTRVSVSPASQDAGSAPPTANLIVGPNITTATFTNQAWGTIEVCKNAADPSTTGHPFLFSVNGGPAFPVQAGKCSPPIPVPAGTADVYELTDVNYHLVTVTAEGPTGDNRLVSGFNPVTVSVPFGGVANETTVTFTNAVNTGKLKICKADNAELANTTFDFTYSGDGVEGLAALKPGECSAQSDPIPVVDANGAPYAITVVETIPPGIDVVSIVVENGSHAGGSPNLATGTAVVYVKQGVTTVTYTNVREPFGADD